MTKPIHQSDSSNQDNTPESGLLQHPHLVGTLDDQVTKMQTSTALNTDVQARCQHIIIQPNVFSQETACSHIYEILEKIQQ
jgi:hypothetical protein